MIKWFLLIVFTLVAGSDVLAQRTRDAVVFADFSAVYSNFFKAKLADDRLEEMTASYNRERSLLMTRYVVMQEEYKKLRDDAAVEAISDEKRTELRRTAEKRLFDAHQMETRISDFDDSQKAKLAEQQSRIQTRFTEEIQQRIKGYAKSKGYTAILDLSLLGKDSFPGVIYLDTDSDITAEIIEELNK